jgi:hypothetical protein
MLLVSFYEHALYDICNSSCLRIDDYKIDSSSWDRQHQALSLGLILNSFSMTLAACYEQGLGDVCKSSFLTIVFYMSNSNCWDY